MGEESSVRSWIRGIRFTPENYDKSVFYVDHDQKNNSYYRPIVSAATTIDNDERKQTILQFNNKSPIMDDFNCYERERTTSFSSFKPQRRFIVGVPSSGLETIEENDLGMPKNGSVFENKGPLATRSNNENVEREDPEVNYNNSDNENNGSSLTRNESITRESETSHLGLDVGGNYPMCLNENDSVVDDDLIGSDDHDTSSDESCDIHGNPCEFLIEETARNSKFKDNEESPKNSKITEEISNSVGCDEPIYVNLEKLKITLNNIEKEHDDFEFLEKNLRRRPTVGFKRNTKSLRRKRYAIMDDLSLKIDIDESCACGTPDSVRISNDSLDTISWKSTCSTFMIDDNVSPNRASSVVDDISSDYNVSLNRPSSVVDDISSDSLSWKSSNSFALTTLENRSSSLNSPDQEVQRTMLPSKDPETLEDEVRKMTILENFKKHATLESFNDPIYMNQRQIVEPHGYVQECIPEPTYEIGNAAQQESESKLNALEELTLTDGEMLRNNETSEIEKSETVDCNNSETYENIWECVSTVSTNNNNNNNSNSKSTSGNNSIGCSFLEAKRWSVKHALVCQQAVEFEIVNELLVAPVTFAQVAFGNVLQWQKDLESQYCSEENLFQEYTSLESINERKEGVSPFPTECDVEVRRKSGDRSITYRSETIHGYVSELEDSIEKEPLNMKKVVKIYIDGSGRKISKNQILQIYKGEMVLLSEKGEREILRKGVNITHYIPYTNKKEIHITNTTADECKLYKLQFDNTEDMNMMLGELHKYFNHDLVNRPRSNSLIENPPMVRHNEERIQIRHRLLKLLRMRSSKDMLEKKGIIKNEPIFGNTLNNLYSKYGVPVPLFVVKVIKIIELPKNIRSLGLYRASGNLATIQKIRFQVDRSNLSILNDYMNDIDVLTGALKLFFRELNEPVIPHKTYEELLQFVDKDLNQSAIEKIKYSISKMDLPHKKTFLTLLKHLVQVEQFKQDNKMDAYNISIVWGPTLIWPPETSQENILENHTNANKIIEILLNIYRNEFLSESESSPPFSVRNRINVNTVLFDNNSQESTKSNKKDLQDNSTKSSPKSKFGSMENLFKAIKKDSVSTPKDTKWNLESICKNSKSNVPEFLQRIIPLIEKNIDVENMYSKQLSDEKLEKIKTKISRNKYGSLEKNNVYELAATVKLFFSELDPPLIPTENFLKMVQAMGKQNEPEKSKLMRQEINKLSSCHRETLSYLFKHLIDVSRRKEPNRVNMALTWMPILCKKLTNTSDIPLKKCVDVVEYLMKFFDENSSTADALIENLKNNSKYAENQQKYGLGCLKAVNNNNNSCENLSKQENNNNNNNEPSESTVKKRIVKNTSALHRESKYFKSSQHPPSIYDTVPPTLSGLSSKEEARGEAKLLETDTNKNVKQKHERTTKL